VLYSRLSLSADWSTAILFWLVLPKYISSASSQCRMRQPVWYLRLDVTTTSPVLLKPSKGYQFGRGSSSRRRYWCGSAPRYLVDLYVPVASAQGRQHLRSASSGMLLVPRTRTTIGQRSFAVNGPTTWNYWLPASLRSSDMMLQTFRRQLKTFLFQH